MLAWNATSKPPPLRPTIAGEVPFIIPSPQFFVPAAPVVQSDPVLAWKAIWYPPPASLVIEGDVPAIIPSRRSPLPPESTFHKLFVFASKAVEKVVAAALSDRLV